MKYLIILMICLTICSVPVLTQDEEDEEEYDLKEEISDTTTKKITALEEIVVTGTRSEKKIIDIPYSVFRVSKKEFTFGRDLNAKDILQDVPGLFIQTRYGSEVRLSIRGFGTRSNSGVRGIRILQDGIPESEPDGETTLDAIDYTSLGGVEVVKGNLSSLYPNSPGGVVNFLSDMNFTKSFVKLTGIAGEYNLFQGGFRAGIAGKNSKLFVSHTYKSYTGFRPHGAEFTHLLNLNYVTYPGKRSSLMLLGNYLRGLARFPGALTESEYNTDPFQPYFQSVASDIRRMTQRARVGLKFKTAWGKFNSNEFEFIGFGSVKDLHYTTNTLYFIKYKYTTGATLRYTGRHPVLGRDNEFTAGIDYNYVTGPLTSYNNSAGSKGDDLQSQNTEGQSNFGVFFENQINLLKGKLYFLLSGRYDKLSISNDDELFSARNSERDFRRFTPKAAFNFKFTPTVSAYTSFGFGFDTPSAAELENYPLSSNSGFTTLNPDIKPQISNNFELGIKGNVFNRGSRIFKKALFEFTFFNTIVKDEIIPFIISDRVYYRNAAQTNRLGLESGIKTEPFERVDLILNYTYTNFKYDRYSAQTFDSTGNLIEISYQNNRVPAVPQHLFNFIVEGEPEIARHLEGLLIFDCDYASSMFTDDRNTESTSPYFFANVMAGIDYKTEHFNLIFAAGLKNIFDRRYIGFINVNANPEQPMGQRRYYEPGEPRNYYVSLNLSYKF
ncbi:MAG TPA: TonB-dependent receptor [Ignavibacteria bacterium]|nr:TonB-dependent receptor [Ignavibacteria bacterium]